MSDRRQQQRFAIHRVFAQILSDWQSVGRGLEVREAKLDADNLVGRIRISGDSCPRGGLVEMYVDPIQEIPERTIIVIQSEDLRFSRRLVVRAADLQDDIRDVFSGASE